MITFELIIYFDTFHFNIS